MWQDVLLVRCLVAPPAPDVGARRVMPARATTCPPGRCGKSGRGALAYKVLVDVLGTNPALVVRLGLFGIDAHYTY